MKERVTTLKNKFMRIGLLLVMCLTMAFGTATTAFAYVDEEAAGEDQPAVEVVEDIPEEEPAEQPGEQCKPEGETPRRRRSRQEASDEVHDGSI